MGKKSSDESKFEGQLREAFYYYEKYDYKKSLDKVNELLRSDKNEIRCRSLKASILIESWDGSKSTKSQIMEALSHLKWLSQEDSKNKSIYLGHKGNAFLHLAESSMREIGKNFKLNREIIENLIKSKNCYHESLEIDVNQPDIWINRGNVLDYLGRHLEALECYDRAILINNKHYNAWGNRGITYWRLSEMVTNDTDKKLLFMKSMKYITIELAMFPDFKIEPKIEKKAKDFIEANNINRNIDSIIKKELPRKINLTNNDFNIYNTMEKSFEEFYNEFCELEGLFLNCRFDCSNCSYSRLDMLDFPARSKISDFRASYNFAKKSRNLLYEYKTARFLLTLAQYKSKDFLFLDEQLRETDHSLNYILSVEILKEAFIKIMNIFDKIAFFLADYEELIRNDGKVLDDKNISFWNPNSIFTQTNILKKNNYQKDLVAIDSIRRDLENDEFKDLRITRDVLVHRCFILHDVINCDKLTIPNDPQNRPLDDLEYHGNINRFYMISKKSLRLIRNILFSLSFFLSQENNRS
jgi:tetratricopeptide (TPR) repeat protein